MIALAAHSLAAPSNAKFPSTSPVNEADDRATADILRDTLINITTALVIGGDGGGSSASFRKAEMHHNEQVHNKPHQQHHPISSLIHLLLTVGSAFAPLVGAIVGPLLTNIANGITWAISHTIASGFSSPHGLFSPELGHGANHMKEHPTSYAAEGQPETAAAAPVDTFQAQQPAVGATVEHAEPATVDDTVIDEAKKIGDNPIRT
ncbi:Hypothetical protein CINCED_3A016845 [Cinara cedri]|uniref:Uncharacterized protein n=1 Tax=Cinara cedri TaxID=506608 RepID=A0A5E4MIP1_9HEMI|nr:Hypothetical protein CINCED_3A016845 [Cinara cedri]